MGVAKSEVCKWIDLQAWLWQNQQKTNCPDRQCVDCLISWEIRNHLHGGSDSWDLYHWKTFQRSKQLPLALQIVFFTGWNEEKDHPFCRRWRCWQQGRPDLQAYIEGWTKVSSRIIFVIWSVNKQLKQTTKKKKKVIPIMSLLSSKSNDASHSHIPF